MYEKIFTLPQNNIQNFSADLAGISYCDETYSITREKSQLYVFEYIISGEGTLYHNNELYHPHQGDFYILKAGARHNYYSDKSNPWTKIWLNCHGSLVGHLLSDYGLSQTVLIRNFNDISIMCEIINICKREVKDKHHEIALLLHRLIMQLCSANQLVIKRKNDNAVMNDNAIMIKEYIETHQEEQIEIKNLAKLVYLSPSRTIHIFKDAYGCTPYDYALKVKMSTAKLLLENTALPVKEIARRVGFKDTHYFSNYFKTVTGLSPKYYRMKNNI